MIAWYDRAFGPWYSKLYPHRNLREAERAVETVASFLPGRGPCLDVGSGAGRHLEVLRERGFDAVGIDRSPALLAEASERGTLHGRLVRADMRRLPFDDRTFAAVLSMFTSFGYFESRSAHARLLSEFARVARREGVLVLDYLNAPEVKRGLVPRSRRRVEGHLVEEQRRIEIRTDDEAVVKELVILDSDGNEAERFHEEVALYDRDVLLALCAEAGWRERTSLGDYDGSSWTPRSPRLLVVAELTGKAR
jgi:SAM-dependent methyltransferase